ncbi:MAG: ferredoxin oxidoreductase [Patescibacteria group bacterium]|nr:ferredoxin oxidoreductase [Patescibacteria group bacterium]
MQTAQRKFMMGNEVAAEAALAAGAEIMFGYPITPTTEVLSHWIKLAQKNNKKFLQTEDEGAAGFATVGACLAGKKAFTATGGPGNILMQDPIVMAESMRIPFVGLIGQRGGPSTGSVIYSQQEVTLTAFGGNGEGYRIVYSPSSLQELYNLTIQAFNTAWHHRFPTFVLYDGYLGKMKGEVELRNPGVLINSKPILEGNVNFRNCVNLEEEIYEINVNNKKAWDEAALHLAKFEFSPGHSKTLVFAHGIVAAAAKAVGINLFRPITLWPFPKHDAKILAKKYEKIAIIESAQGQLGRLVKEALFGLDIEVQEIYKPALGFTPEEIKGVIE